MFADSFHDLDFAGPFGHAHQHDVGDADGRDDERDAAMLVMNVVSVDEYVFDPVHEVLVGSTRMAYSSDVSRAASSSN